METRSSLKLPHGVFNQPGSLFLCAMRGLDSTCCSESLGRTEESVMRMALLSSLQTNKQPNASEEQNSAIARF